ncbi:MAG: amidohydrolase family protein [Gammaproteobacteria bacterium]|nr:amidohydrolase family protein [Pseudomonadales bacterium]MCP5348189.1 amidohydrolase family protein [Pseudomonadales bacterium]
MLTFRLLRNCGLSLVLLACPLLAGANDGNLAFIGATLIDGTGSAPIENGVIVITDGRIRAVGPASDVTLPEDARVIDVSGKTIMPGLINAHGHAGGTLGLETGHYSRANLLRQLGLYGRYGVTTVVSLGDDEEQGFALRDEQARTDLDYARLFVAGDVISGDSVAEVRSAVNRVADLGANFIKTRVDDNLGRTPKPAPEIVAAIIDQAHIRRLPAAIHLYYLEDAKAVLRAGGDIIAHSIRDLPVDQEVIDLIQARNVCYIPTLTREISTFVYESEPEFFSDPFFLAEADPAVLDELRSPERQSRMRNSAAAQQYKVALDTAMQNIARLNTAGVRIAMGTDSGPPARFQGYFEHMELWLMVEAGMTPMEAITAATGVAARCMNLDGLGTLEPGNWADLIVLGENPLTDIENTRSIESVWIAGNPVPDS